MIVRIFLSFIFLINSISFAHAEPSYSLSLSSPIVEKSEQDMVTQHEDIDLQIGDLKMKAKFLYAGEVAPVQGYLIKFKDVRRLESFLSICESGCGVVLEEMKKEYQQELLGCQKQCDERIMIISSENDDLKKRAKDLKSDLESEQTQKIIWAIASAVSGAGLGILVYNIAK